MGQTVLILGAGVGGLVAANEVRKRLPRENRVVVVDRESSYLFAPSLLWLMTGARTPEKISRPLSRLGRKGIEVVVGEIESLDPARRTATVGGRLLSGDFLIVALGAELAPELVPGLTAAGHNFYTLPGATTLRDALASFTGGRLVILTAGQPYKCPAAPYEAAMLIEAYCRKRRIRERTQLDLYAAEPAPMGVAGPEISRAVRQMVEAKGITYHPEHQMSEVDTASRKLRFKNGAEVPFDLLAYVPPHRAPRVIREAGLAAEGKYVDVDRNSMATRFDRVFAIGDVTGIPLKMGKPLPKAGVFAHTQAEAVACNIALAITGKGRSASFDGHGECFIETGDGKAGYGAGNFYAEPAPDVRMRPPSWRWHVSKVLFEKNWLRRWF
ncbi:MAG: NAD(P)/FAD-dependent oxidoreductase [Nitrospirae bacterium]|nr:NAD(P)/FAD-dependent oxidoreductase [Nitrospirota bacterium]